MQFSSDFFYFGLDFILVSLSFWRSNYLSPFGFCRPSGLLCLWHLIFALFKPGPENRRITIICRTLWPTPPPDELRHILWATPHPLSYAAPFFVAYKVYFFSSRLFRGTNFGGASCGFNHPTRMVPLRVIEPMATLHQTGDLSNGLRGYAPPHRSSLS